MKKVFVGVSGGVDSSVSALLLKKSGYDVTGVFIKVWHPDFIPCNWREEMRDAMRVCAKLNIPFLFCDLEKEYKKEVIDYLINEYKTGRTPNPDVMCNKEIKFKAFFDFAIKKGADYIATGHYAIRDEKNNEFRLLESEDENKDQSYFLWNLNQKLLKKTLFPIGHLKKTEVRKIAQKNNLITASKKDSQGLCFVGQIDMKVFLKRFINTLQGDVINEKGEIVGKHDGAILYTIGERHNFEIFQKTSNEKVYYVINKDLNKNTLTVSTNKKNQNYKTVEISDFNFIRTKDLINNKIKSRIRYRQPLQNSKIMEIKDNSVLVGFEEIQDSVTQGQSLVMYKDGECLGGGIII